MTAASRKPVAAATCDRIVICAALLWCRRGTLPTAREVADAARVSPSTVIGAFGSLPELYDAVTERELAKIERCVRSKEPQHWLASHAAALHAFDRVLVRLPALVLARASSAGSQPAWLRPGIIAALHAVGALVARPRATLDDALDCIDPASSHARRRPA